MEKREPSALLVGMQIGAATVENSMEYPQKITDETAFSPSDSTAGNVPQESQITNSKELKHSYVHGSTIYNRQVVETV